MMLNVEKTDTHPARAGRVGGKSIRRATDCTRRKAVAIALEVVPFDVKVVAHHKMLFRLAALPSRMRERWRTSLSCRPPWSLGRVARSKGRIIADFGDVTRPEIVAIESHAAAKAPEEPAILSRCAAM
jgi:hypothetical protein